MTCDLCSNDKGTSDLRWSWLAVINMTFTLELVPLTNCKAYLLKREGEPLAPPLRGAPSSHHKPSRVCGHMNRPFDDGQTAWFTLEILR